MIHEIILIGGMSFLWVSALIWVAATLGSRKARKERESLADPNADIKREIAELHSEMERAKLLKEFEAISEAFANIGIALDEREEYRKTVEKLASKYNLNINDMMRVYDAKHKKITKQEAPRPTTAVDPTRFIRPTEMYGSVTAAHRNNLINFLAINGMSTSFEYRAALAVHHRVIQSLGQYKGSAMQNKILLDRLAYAEKMEAEGYRSMAGR